MGIVNAFSVYISSLSDDTLKVETKFQDLIVFFKTRLLCMFSEDKCIELFERLRLEYFYRLLQCQAVERKMFGMSEIRNVVDVLVKSDPSTRQGASIPGTVNNVTDHSTANSQVASINISKRDVHIKVFTTWVGDKRLLDYLFEKDVHRELLRQSICRFTLNLII